MIRNFLYDKQSQKILVRILRLIIVTDNIIESFLKANYGYWLHYWNILEKYCNNVVLYGYFFTHENE